MSPRMEYLLGEKKRLHNLYTSADGTDRVKYKSQLDEVKRKIAEQKSNNPKKQKPEHMRGRF